MKSITRKKLIGKKAPNWKGGIYTTKLVCATCKKEFVAHRRRKYCSKECVYKNRERNRKISETRVANGNAITSEIDRLINRKWAEYNASAKRMNSLFELDRGDFKNILLSNCNYCGSDIALGIDRLDSSKGYIKSNSVPCCTKCNFAKHTMSVEEFKEHILLIYYNFLNK